MNRASESSSLAIDVKALSKHFGDRHVVKDVSLQVARGEIFGFLGPNGSGKTTTIRMLCGLLTPDSGTGSCLGHDILQGSALIKREVGYMTQRFTFWEDLSLRENLDFVARVYGVKNRRQAVDKTLREFGLMERSQQLAGTLSGGWKQRLALAACLLHEPKLLLLDEPTAGVDPSARRDFWEEIHALAARGISILVSTHYMDEAERCHKLAYIAWGNLLAQGTAEEISQSVGLSTYTVRGQDITKLTEFFRNSPGVDQIVAFGSSLHVSGKNAHVLSQTMSAAGEGHEVRVEKVATGLEDAFIHLMGSARGRKEGLE